MAGMDEISLRKRGEELKEDTTITSKGFFSEEKGINESASGKSKGTYFGRKDRWHSMLVS